MDGHLNIKIMSHHIDSLRMVLEGTGIAALKVFHCHNEIKWPHYCSVFL